jgi:hypothetical protein
VVLYWRVLEPQQENFQSFVHLTYPSSVSWGQSDNLNPGGLPTSRWTAERYVWDEHQVEIRPGTPPGEYTLEAGLYTLTTGRRLSVLGPDGTSAGETVVLEIPVEVLPSRSPPEIDELGMEDTVYATYDGQMTLLGYTTPSRLADPPGFLRLTLFWQAEQRYPEDFVVTVAVVDETDEPVAMASGPPAIGRHPMSNWTRGEIVRDPYAFWFGEDFPPGRYEVGVVLHRGDQPVTPEGFDDAFLRLFATEVR